MKEAIYDWMKCLAVFYILLSTILHLVPTGQYERYVRFFMGLLLIFMLCTPVFHSGKKRGDYKEFSGVLSDRGKLPPGAGSGKSAGAIPGKRVRGGNRKKNSGKSAGERNRCPAGGSKYRRGETEGYGLDERKGR